MIARSLPGWGKLWRTGGGGRGGKAGRRKGIMGGIGEEDDDDEGPRGKANRVIHESERGE